MPCEEEQVPAGIQRFSAAILADAFGSFRKLFKTVPFRLLEVEVPFRELSRREFQVFNCMRPEISLRLV